MQGLAVEQDEEKRMIALKPGTKLTHLTPGMAWAVFRIHEVYNKAGVDVLTITSGDDYDHGQVGVPDDIDSADPPGGDPKTLHGKGRACDFRTHGTSEDFRRCLVDRVRAALTVNGICDFDVLLEKPGTDKEHLHCEQQRLHP
jgi:hypothetical protein